LKTSSELRIAHDRMDLNATGPGLMSTFFSPLFPDMVEWAEGGIKAIIKLRESKPTEDTVLRICLITDAMYWAETQGLIYNLLHRNRGRIEAHILSLDDFGIEKLVPKGPRLTVHIVTPQEIWSQREWLRLKRSSHAIQAYCSKSRLLRHAVVKARQPVLYLDSDLYFFKDPIHLAERLKRHSVLLFPHWNDESSHTRVHGLFNAGLVGVSPRGVDFLEWWSKLCLVKCSKEAGFFDDQGYLDLVPIYFKNVGIYRRGDENVAKWNVKTLDVSVSAFTGIRMGKQLLPVGSIHTPGSDEMGLFEAKVAWDQLVAFRSLKRLPAASKQRLFERVGQVHRRYNLQLDQVYAFYESLRQRVPKLKPMNESRLLWWKKHWRRPANRIAQRTFHLLKGLRHRKHAIERDLRGERWVKLQQRWLERN
jgi:hypothetical protein